MFKPKENKAHPDIPFNDQRKLCFLFFSPRPLGFCSGVRGQRSRQAAISTVSSSGRRPSLAKEASRNLAMGQYPGSPLMRIPIQPLKWVLKWVVNSPTNQNGAIGFDNHSHLITIRTQRKPPSRNGREARPPKSRELCFMSLVSLATPKVGKITCGCSLPS